MRPATRFRIVDLPLPEGPRRHRNSPAAARREVLRRISTVPFSFATEKDTSSRTTLAPALGGGFTRAGGREDTA
jgi:hypothetical protein